MPTMEDFFSSKYLKAEDLRGREVEVVIDSIKSAMMQDRRRAVLAFQGKEKMLLLNKTNATKIANAYGQNMDLWIGKKLILYPDETNFQGQMVPCLRVRAVQPPSPQQREPGEDPLPF